MKTSDYNPPMTDKERLICKKINRISKKNGPMEKICKSRSLQMFLNVGRFYMMDISRNTILFHNVDPASWLREVIKK
jgi:hypothetical protein